MSTRREFLQHMTVASVLAAASSGVQPEDSALVGVKTPLETYRIPNTELVISHLAFGTGFLDFDWTSSDFIAGAIPAIRTAYENGITLFDLADIYGHGKSELAMGRVIEASPGLRSRIIIQSKCGLQIPDNWGKGDPILGVNLTRAHIVRAVEGSLTRLGTDYLDILLLHAPDALVQTDEVAQAFDDLSREGKVRCFGVSNHGIAQIELLKQHVRQPLVVNQILLGLANYAALDPMSGTGVVEYCRSHAIQIQAHSPLRGGLLKPPADASTQLKQVAQQLLDLAKQKDTNPSAIALAWLLRHPAGIAPVIGSSKPGYIIENCAAGRVVLTHEEWYALFYAAAGIQRKKVA